ncbi:MAG TPA: Arc family DNA-binding protein [Ramlibacter sp.]|uniref:FitA-like ribbon-helix-helix domain-containing protein n=1 Tax=Ramlibacter sp. TaxID=1917967 RepID=UPI002D7F2DA6|nr:Arc family DNA-binding protein [Ramlibacter sp.]HET8747962.1 Arc family DNA-binding protein [Ramlibacter sp.]
MPNLSIKDVPEELAEALRQRAARNHRSLQGELMAIIHEAVHQEAVHGGSGAARAPTSPHAGWRTGTRTIEEIDAELRARHPEPVQGGPLAVDIIRADRDSR